MKVEKRDGTLQDFNFEKIKRAVNSVYLCVIPSKMGLIRKEVKDER